MLEEKDSQSQRSIPEKSAARARDLGNSSVDLDGPGGAGVRAGGKPAPSAATLSTERHYWLEGCPPGGERNCKDTKRGSSEAGGCAFPLERKSDSSVLLKPAEKKSGIPSA